MRKNELYELLKRYENPSYLELSEALDAIKQLADDKQISNALAKNISKLLISKHIYSEILNEIRDDFYHGQQNSDVIRFTGLKYGRQHETYA